MSYHAICAVRGMPAAHYVIKAAEVVGSATERPQMQSCTPADDRILSHGKKPD